eukprot:COSAG06_NODE_15042_length_1102_cov_0.634098_1_plen_34_part_10
MARGDHHDSTATVRVGLSAGLDTGQVSAPPDTLR